MDYQEKTNRASDIALGLLTAGIACLLLLLVFFLLLKAKFDISYVAAVLFLSLPGYWFGLLSYRLLLNKPSRDGGLLSNTAIKAWCIFFALGSVVVLLRGIVDLDINKMASALMMLPASWCGWQLANKRQRSW